MSYETPDRTWVEIEMKLLDGMGKTWFLNNPPKIWKLPKRPDDLILESFKKRFKECGWKFKYHVPFVHRYMRDLISDQKKIIIHHREVSVSERKICKILGYSFFKFKRSNWRIEIDRIIGEIENGKNKSMVR